MKGLINIDEVVRSVIADEQRNTLHKYIWYLHYALDFVREWNIDYHSNIVTRKVKLDDNNGFCYPDDYVNFQSVGVKLGDRIMAFTQDSSITSITEGNQPNKKFINEYESELPDTYGNIFPYAFYNLKSDNKEDVNLDVYLMGATYPGYYKIDHKRKRIQLSAEVKSDYVYLEYVTNGLQCTEMSVIPEIAIDLIKTYIKWKSCRYKQGINSPECQLWEREFSKVRGQLLVRQSNLSYLDILNTLKRNYSQKVMN